MSATSVLARKWRPRNFAQLAGQTHVVQALGNALAQNRLHHAYLFTGTRGVGKTTIARIFAKSLNCENGVTATPCGECHACTSIDAGRFVDLIELDAASNTQVDNMRELLESALYAPTAGRFKVYIIDEVHMLSKSAFNAMLKTLEEPPSHVKFILATTDPQKIPVTVLSRCLQFNLKQLPPALILEHLQYILGEEKMLSEPAALSLLARAAQGSMRDALSLLDQAIAYSSGNVNEATVRSMLGAIDRGYLFDLLTALSAGEGGALLRVADDMALRSIAFDAALQDLATLLHRLALMQLVPQAIPEDEPERVQLQVLSQKFSAEEIQLYYQIAIHGRNEIALAPDEYAGFSMTLLRMLAFMPQGASAPSRVPPARVPAPPVADSPAARPAPLPTTPAKTQEVARAADLDWNALVSQLGLRGMALQLAKNCVMASFADNRMVLNLAMQQKASQTPNARESLQTALSEYFAKPIKLLIELVAASAEATPAALEQEMKQAQQQQARDAIMADPFVREAQQELGARVLENSIKPIQ